MKNKSYSQQKILVLIDHRTGNNNQSTAIANSIGNSVTIHRVSYTAHTYLPNVILQYFPLHIKNLEKIMIKFKFPQGLQKTVALMGKIRNIFSIDVGRYKKNAVDQRLAFKVAKSIWELASQRLLSA